MIQQWNQIGDQWAGIMLPLAWQGAIAIALIWALTKIWPSLPAAKRHWLWRLVYLKLLVLACWQTPIDLPVLPAENPSLQGPTSTQSFSAPETFDSPRIPKTVFAPTPIFSEYESPQENSFLFEDNESSASISPNATAWILLFWFLGLLTYATRAARACNATACLVKESTTLSGTKLYDLFIDLSQQARLKRTPRLLSHPGISSPLVVGCLRPCIIVPENHRDTPISNDTRLILLHELSHIGRRDLWWGWLRVIVESLTFFHPMVWIARRHWNLTQEMACDEAVVNRAQVTAPVYQQALLRTLEQGRKQHQISSKLLAVGASGSFRDMKERMIAMNRIQPRSPLFQFTAACLVATIGLAGVLPYQLVAKPKKNASKETSESIFDDLGGAPTEKTSKPHSEDEFLGGDDDFGESSGLFDASPDEETSESVLSPVIQGLSAALTSSQPEVRKRVVEALAELEDPAAIPVLIRALQDSHPDVRHEALHGLEEFDDPRALEAVVKLLDSDSWKTRNQAIDALEDFAHPNAAHSLFHALNDPHPKNRLKALDALDDLHHPDLFGAAEKSLLDSHWQVRREAADLLGESHSPGAIDPLVHALLDSHPAVRNKAFDALQELEADNLHEHIEHLAQEHPDKFHQHARHFLDELAKEESRRAERHQREMEREAERQAERHVHQQLEIARMQAEQARQELKHAFESQRKESKEWPEGFDNDEPVDPFSAQGLTPAIEPVDVNKIIESVLSKVNAQVEEAVAKALSDMEKRQAQKEKSGLDPFQSEPEKRGKLF